MSTEENGVGKLRSVVFVCQVFHPDEISTSQLFSPLMRALASKGYDVTVLCGFPASGSPRHLPRFEIWEEVKIRRCGLRVPLKKNMVSRVLAYGSYLLEATLRLMGSARQAQWLGVTNPPFLAWFLAAASAVRRKSFDFMLLDLQPEGLVALREVSESAFLVRAWMALNRVSYRAARRLIVLGRDMPPILWKNYGIGDSGRLPYLPHWSAAECSAPPGFGASKFVDLWGLRNRFVVQYSGNMGLWHDLETFVRAAKELENEPGFQFVFIGGGMRRKGAMNLARELGVGNIQWHDFVPLEKLSESLAACHVSLLSLMAGLEGVAVPCKLYGILASGRPVLAQVPKDSEVALTVGEHECGVVVEPGDVVGLVNALRSMALDPERLRVMGDNAFKAYQAHYRLDSAARAFDLLLSGVDSRPEGIDGARE